ncbi:putative ABC transport system permease protein [Pontibacter ummariensis]|uniref:Putative ABC transport system permease protein n=1 Tax=Pontibacter ummariensis TaxID=1610492 RepID=A0A239JWL8_9BACT|nr:ABC transporter permease [Pontibacter ummariensis]PRY07297.1 putative ABC transport system permease protein [Pontibacter ummariensis]SNT10205.1 putative ABC transport system permease protein [Pontibacter ummariensis]
MFRNYFKTAYRNLFRHKAFTFINLSGLTLGLTACLLIGLFVYDELQYDKFLPEGDRVYRLYNDMSARESGKVIAPVPPMFGTTLEQNFPEVEKVVRILMLQFEANNLVEVGEKSIYENGRTYADPGFFEMFQLPFKYGSHQKALADPSSIVISDRFAERVFGEVDPVGRKVTVNKEPFIVRGVFERNDKFHLPVNFVLPMEAAQLPAERMKKWSWQQFYTYVKLKEGADPGFVQEKFRKIVAQQIDPDKNQPYDYLPVFQPLEEVYLYSASFSFDQAIRGNITYVKALSIIAVFILLIACFNFVNLSTAKSSQRAKEVGVRKAVGASKGQLVAQFLSETLLLTLISVIFSAALASLLLPTLNAFAGKQMEFNVFGNPAILLLLLVLAVVVGVLAGFYPAMVLSGFKPVKVLKSAVVVDSRVGKIQWLRHGLIVLQFALSIFLIICAGIVYQQVSYLHNKDLGFNKEQIMFFQMRGDQMFENYETFKQELLKSPKIKNVSIGYGFPGDATAGDRIIVPRNGEQVHHGVTQLMIDYNYLNTLDVKVVAGRPFSKEFKTDTDHAFMINETAVRELGYRTPEKALGQPLQWQVWSDENPDSLKEGKIIGVVKDFHFKSLYDKVEPTVLQIFPEAYHKVAVKIDAQNVAGAIDHVKDVWSTFSPDYPIEYIFMDDNFQKMYKAEDKLKTLLWIFTGIAIFVACLGLFGLAAYAAERRKKEIGIRKVLGAENSMIVALLSKEFLLLILVSALIAFPLAWYAMHTWLQDFAYRIDIPVWVFLVASLVAALVAFLTVSYQALKAATANPVTNLRFE